MMDSWGGLFAHPLPLMPGRSIRPRPFAFTVNAYFHHPRDHKVKTHVFSLSFFFFNVQAYKGLKWTR